MLPSQTPKEQVGDWKVGDRFVYRGAMRTIYLLSLIFSKAGLKRTKEMSSLYGGESILIQTLETNLQMKFDEFSDAHRPPLWPSIPLNLSYGR